MRSPAYIAFVLLASCGKSETSEPPTRAVEPAPPATPAPATAAANAPDTAAAAPAPFTCAPADTLKLDLVALEKSFSAEHAAYAGQWRTEPPKDSDTPGIDPAKVPKFGPLMRQLGLADQAGVVDLDKDETSFDVFDCSFAQMPLASEAGAKDVVVSVGCQNESSPELHDGEALYAGVVLRPLDGGTYCKLGAITAADSVSARPCVSDYGDTPQWKLSPVELVAAGRQAIAEDWSGGTCGNGTLRGDHVTRRYWGVEGGKLVPYMEAVLDDATYESPCPPTRGQVGTIVFGKSFPKTIAYARENTCQPAGDGCDADTACAPAKGVETWVYTNGTYQRQGPPALADDAGGDEPTTAPALVKRARGEAKAKSYAAAVADYQKAYGLDPEMAHLRGELGWALFLNGQLPDARTITDAALAKADKSGSKAALLYNLGRIDEAEKKPADAITHYQASLAARPDNELVQKRLEPLLKPLK